MSERVPVANVEELREDGRKLVTVDGTSVGVIAVDGEHYALENECPHQGGPVCTGRVGGQLEAEHSGVGDRTVERVSDKLSIACPWHGWEYDLETGEHLATDRIALQTYDVEVDDETVYIRV